MAARTIFFNLPAGNQSAALIDQMFSDFANWIIIPCTASGANNITLTPMSIGGGGIPTIPAYLYQQVFSFVAAATSTGLMFAQLSTLAQLPIYLSDGVTQAGAGKTVLNQQYWLQYNPALNNGAGGFFLLSPVVPVVSNALFGPSIATGVTVTNTFINADTGWNISATSATLSNATGSGNIQRNSVSASGNTGTAGLDGLDTGALAANTWYNVWLIDNGTISGTLLSLSQTSPVLPAGYIYAMRVGAMFVDSGLKLLKTLQVGNRATYVVTPSTNTPALPQIAAGSAGNVNTPTYIAVRVRNGVTSTTQYVPPTAQTLRLAYAVGGTQTILIAPNGNYNIEGTVNPPPITIVYGGSGSVGIAGNSDMVLESDNIYWASTGGINALYALGWIDSAAVF